MDELESSLRGDLLVVLDDAHVLGDGPAAWRLVETLVRVAPPAVHIVLGSRTEPPFTVERLRSQGEVQLLGEPELAFGPDEVGGVLATVVAGDAPAAAVTDLATRIHALTAGWPAAVRLTAVEEDLYEDYSAGVREEAQAAYAEAAREVARAAVESGDPDTAIRIQLRILEHDQFDERAHVGLVRALVAAGRHGEARRRYGVSAARMAEIGVEAAPYPATTASSVA